MDVAFLGIGNELVDGLVQESNSSFIAKKLLEIGLSLREKLQVRDKKEDIISTIRYLIKRNDCIIVTGGLGPTQDDITRESIAELTKKKLILDNLILEKIQRRFSKLNIEMPEENKKQAMVIEGSTVIPNSVGTAPGFIIKNTALIAVFPGVPSEVRAMFNFFIRYIKSNFTIKKKNSSVYIQSIGVPESVVDHVLKEKLSPDIKIGTIARNFQLTVRLDFPYSSQKRSLGEVEKLKKAFPDFSRKIFSLNPEESIEEAVYKKLLRKNKKVIFAESCTGGLVSKLITDIPGSSEIFLGSVICYSNLLKKKLLHVPDSILQSKGAVSFECAHAMLCGLKKIARSDYYISITGIAGPTGGSKDKPVGTIFIGFSKNGQDTIYKFYFPGTREHIRRRTAIKVFELLWEDLNYRSIDTKLQYGLVETKTV